MKTLGEFIVEKQAEYPNAKGELSGILSSIRLVAKVIHRDINKAGLTNNIIGNSGVENVQGEAQMKLDLFAHNTMKQALMSREEVAGFASEEEENFIAFDTERGRNAKYVILTDPLDGSSNIDVNVAVGTIFSIYRRISPVGTPVTLEDFMPLPVDSGTSTTAPPSSATAASPRHTDMHRRAHDRHRLPI